MSSGRILYANPACPFAQRTEALLTRLDLPFELRNFSLYRKDPEFLRISPTGKVPLLVEPDGTVLYESNIIAEYLADRYDFEGFSPDSALRAQQRLAMKQFDAVVVKLLYYRDIRAYPLRLHTPAERRALVAELDLLEEVVAQTPIDSLLALHLAPFWLRFRWLSFLIRAESTVRQRPDLARWLDEAAALPSIASTADEEAFVPQYRWMKRIVWVYFAVALVAVLASFGTTVVVLVMGGAFL